jgi:colanic acid/amylovoran biosynthesis glycosyltransferase
MIRDRMKKIAYIASGKIGIHRFTFNELKALEENGIHFILCLTQLKPGPWMPDGRWPVQTASFRRALLELSSLAFTRPHLTCRLVKEARRHGVMPYLFAALGFHRTLKTHSISSVHCQMGDSKLFIGYFLKQLMNVPLSVTVHAHELYQEKVYKDPASVQFVFSNCDQVFTISEFNAAILKKRFHVKPGKLKIMRLFPEIDPRGQILNKAKILIVANWAEKKGYSVLLQAVRDLQRTDFILWIVGGPYFSENSIDVEKLIQKYHIGDKVVLFGRQGGAILDILFSACDIFCLPSHTEYFPDGKPAEREGIPVALMEAMAWGKPVISTRHAGIPELVRDVLVRENNVDQLKKAIETMLNHPEKWKEMGRRNKKWIAQKYSKQNVRILADTLKQWQQFTI